MAENTQIWILYNILKKALRSTRTKPNQLVSFLKNIKNQTKSNQTNEDIIGLNILLSKN